MGLFLKNFPALTTALDDDTLFAVDGDGDYTYITSLGDVSSYIGASVTINPPLKLEDPSGFSDSLGTMTVVGTTGVATVSSSIDHGNLSVDDIIYFNDGTHSVVVSIGSDPNLVLLPCTTQVAKAFFYGEYTILTKDSLGNITSATSNAGIMTPEMLMAEDATFRAAVTDTINVKEIRTIYPLDLKITNSDGSLVMQRASHSGLISTPWQPSFCAKMSANQVVTSGGWTKVNFNISTGTDTEKITHNRVPSGAVGYSDSNRCFQIPYSTPQPSFSYDISFSIRAYYQVTAPPGNNIVYGKVMGASSATATSGWTLLYTRNQDYASSTTNFDTVISTSSTMFLDPDTNANHRYLSVWVYSSNSNITLDITGGGQLFFSGSCNG